MRKLGLLLIALFVCWQHISAQGQKDSAAQAKEIIQQSILLQATWQDVHTPHQAKFEAVLRKQEKDADGATKQYYEFHVEGLPTGQQYQLERWPIATLHFFTIAAAAKINEAGMLICADTKKPCYEETGVGSPVGIWLRSAQGEPLRFVLSTEDDKIRITATVVPFPATGTDQGCTLKLLRLIPNGQIVFTRGEGFPPRSDVTLIVESSGKKEKEHVTVTEDGLILNAESPSMSGGKDSGELRVTATKGSSCHPSAVISWGEASGKSL